MSTRSRSFVLTITPHEGHPAARRFLSTPTGSSSPSSAIEHPETGQFQQRVIEFAAATLGGGRSFGALDSHENGKASCRAS
jgi:hypothetical protein